MYIYVYTYIYVCVHVYIHVCMYMYTYRYTHTSAQLRRLPSTCVPEEGDVYSNITFLTHFGPNRRSPGVIGTNGPYQNPGGRDCWMQSSFASGVNTAQGWIIHLTRTNESRHTHTRESWHTDAYIWMSHGTQMNESWHTCEWVMSHKWAAELQRLSSM